MPIFLFFLLFHYFHLLYIRLHHGRQDTLVTLSLIGLIAIDVIFFVAIINYAVQCEMTFNSDSIMVERMHL